MGKDQVTMISGIELSQAEPTVLSLQELHDWVVWQFPGSNAKAHHAAVRPSIPGHGWFPAVIDTKRLQVTVYGYIDEPLNSPEAASKRLVRLLGL